MGFTEGSLPEGKISAEIMSVLPRVCERLPVIIELSSDAVALDAIPAKLEGFEFKCDLAIINAIAGTISPDQIQSLAAKPSVYKVYPDKMVQACLNVATPALRAHLIQQRGTTGKSVTAAVVDTGVHPHPDLTRPENRLVAFADFVGKKGSPYDDNGHGTHVAGEIAGNGYSSNGRYKGIAPEARIAGVKVLDQNGKGQTSTVIQGLDWCLKNRSRHNIRVVNLSMGSPAGSPPHEDPLCKAVERLWDAGIVVLVAAGNDGPADKTILSPGNDPKVITIGAMDDKRTVERKDDAIADFSARGPTAEGLAKPDILAPGVGITSLKVPKGSPGFRLRGSSRTYQALSGTSMATSLAAGVAVLMLDHEPGLTPDEVKQRMMSSAENRGYDANVQGRGYIDANKAVRP
ncbi:MAG: S8 family serine peptidase [Firmicutes bacterium]|nr:S8 family serine peptidase [Bacillota bacterium]